MGFDTDEIVKYLKADAGYPKGLESEKYSLAGLKESLRFGFIHEQPDVDLEIELEELGIVVWTSKNTFEPKREVTKSELLWIALKANCYDLSGNTRENWQERTVWIAVWDGILNNSNIWVNEKITKAEAYEYMLKAGKVKTPKSSNTEAMKYLGVIGEDENDESTTLPREKAASIILKLIRLYNK